MVWHIGGGNGTLAVPGAYLVLINLNAQKRMNKVIIVVCLLLLTACQRNEEQSAENMVMVYLKPVPRLRSLSRLFSFGELAVKGRAVKGNLVTKHAVDRVVRPPKEGGDLELE